MNQENRKAGFDVDDRRYVVRDREGDFFAGWNWTSWKCVKRIALWTKNREEAQILTWNDLGVGIQHGPLSASDQFSGTLAALTCGYSNTRLERVA